MVRRGRPPLPPSLLNIPPFVLAPWSTYDQGSERKKHCTKSPFRIPALSSPLAAVVCGRSLLFSTRISNPGNPFSGHNFSEPSFEKPHHHNSSSHHQQSSDSASAIDIAEHQYRSKFQPAYHNEGHVVGSTVDVASYRPSHKESTHVDDTTVDFPALPAPPRSTSYKEKIVVDETTVDFPTYRAAHKKAPSLYSESTVDIQENELSLVKVSNNNTSSKMGYYDEDCKYRTHHPNIIYLSLSFVPFPSLLPFDISTSTTSLSSLLLRQ
ncbi:hypothetical protein QBC45DRAFT_188968 [Copromyces sp. CBS 386.78]|nr:hypothetical protein QBC45DRAFT_188968 [Copromyces sp. CBS 386.78]